MKYIFFLFFVLLTFSGCAKHEAPIEDMAISAVKLSPKNESASSELKDKMADPAASQIPKKL